MILSMIYLSVICVLIYKSYLVHNIPMIVLHIFLFLYLFPIFIYELKEDYFSNKDEKQPKSKHVYTYSNQNLSWEELKKTINQHYQALGYTDVTVDTDSSYMIKNPKVENSYIFATITGDDIKVEVFNAPKFEV